MNMGPLTQFLQFLLSNKESIQSATDATRTRDTDDLSRSQAETIAPDPKTRCFSYPTQVLKGKSCFYGFKKTTYYSTYYSTPYDVRP